VTKFCAGTILTSQVMDCKTRAIGKAIRPLFAEPVTFWLLVYCLFNHWMITLLREFCINFDSLVLQKVAASLINEVAALMKI